MAAIGAWFFAAGYSPAFRCCVKSSSFPSANNYGKVRNQKPAVASQRYAVSTEQKNMGTATYPENGRMKVNNGEDEDHKVANLSEEEKQSSCNDDDDDEEEDNIIIEKKKKKKKNAYAMALEGKGGGMEQGKGIKDYFEESKGLISSDAAAGGPVVASPPPPRWFSPVECGPRLVNAPLLLYLPGFSLFIFLPVECGPGWIFLIISTL